MEIVVGREQQSRRLCIIRDGQSQLGGQPGSVPMDVSRQHLRLQSQGEGKWKIQNLNAQNVTWVNGIAVESKVISENDKVELGKSHYLLSWDMVRGPKVEYVDISQLKRVWDNYQERDLEIRNRQKNNGLLASVPLGFSMLGGIIAGIGDDEVRKIALIFTVVAFILFLVGLYRRFEDNSTMELKDNQEDFESKWVCPKCGRPLNYRSFTVLMQNDGCPYCKAKFKKEGIKSTY